jgi:hypothetical protein
MLMLSSSLTSYLQVVFSALRNNKALQFVSMCQYGTINHNLIHSGAPFFKCAACMDCGIEVSPGALRLLRGLSSPCLLGKKRHCGKSEEENWSGFSLPNPVPGLLPSVALPDHNAYIKRSGIHFAYPALRECLAHRGPPTDASVLKSTWVARKVEQIPGVSESLRGL